MNSVDEEEEDDDPTSSSSLSLAPETKAISDDVLFLCFEWLFPSELCRCMRVNKHWEETAKDNHLWRVQCALCFARVSSKNLAKKYANSYHSYYRRHYKLRFDGVYVLKVLYYIQSEATLFTTPITTKPYTTIEYYRYLRFFNNQCKIIVNEKNHKLDKIKNDESFNCIYAMDKNKPSEYALFHCFGAKDVSHQNIGKGTSSVVASLYNKKDGIITHQKVFAAKYDISNKKMVKIKVSTDYGLALELGLKYYEVVEGASNRLRMEYFDGLRVNAQNMPIESSRDHYEARHEPFVFIPDTQFGFVDEWFD